MKRKALLKMTETQVSEQFARDRMILLVVRTPQYFVLRHSDSKRIIRFFFLFCCGVYYIVVVLL